MVPNWEILLIALAYIGLLFGVAYYGDQRAERGRSIINNPYVYALSLGVYCTAWTFYGSVGRAATTGIGFLPIYLGPTLMAALWWFVLRKIIRISKVNRITSIADFISSRYGKSTPLGVIVTLIAIVGIMPYISLQLKAIYTSFTILQGYPTIEMPASAHTQFILADTAFYVAVALALFAILFGTRHLDVTEHHEGLVAAIAFESVIKLLAFLAAGVFVVWGMYQGLGNLYRAVAAQPNLSQLFAMPSDPITYVDWLALNFVSMMAIIFLPRQFQMAVVENVNEQHVRKATWLFPLYMLAINLFVLPITFAGLLVFPAGSVDADTFVLTLPMRGGQPLLAMFVFLGGLSAATGMVIVETLALSTMVCNDLVTPLLLRIRMFGLSERQDISGVLLNTRRITILLIMFLGYGYFRLASEAYALVSIGLVSFAAVAQFAPAFFGGLYWKEGSRAGAVAGLLAGFGMWGYTLFLPSLARSGWLSLSFVEQGPWSIAWLKPYELFGLSGLDSITHALFWSMLVNIGAYVGVSLVGRQSAIEHSQANLFVDVFKPSASEGVRLWRGTATLPDLRMLLARFLGPVRAEQAFEDYARRRNLNLEKVSNADAELVAYVEKLLAGALGAASARVMVASVVQEEPLTIEEVMEMLSETSQVIAYSRQLEHKSKELQAATDELRAATNELRASNERLTELDRLKDDFMSTVTHELRTPLTSIRAFTEILYDHPDLPLERRVEFLGIVLKESERLTRLINQVLDLAKIESGNIEWHLTEIDLRDIIADAVNATSHLFDEKQAQLLVEIPDAAPLVIGDHDRLMQVMLNLLSNALKFCDSAKGWVKVSLDVRRAELQVDVSDNGPGVPPENQEMIFEKFRQVKDVMHGKPQGTGLGLPISRRIIDHFGGRLWVTSDLGHGSTFSFVLPVHNLAGVEVQPVNTWQDPLLRALPIGP